MFIRVKVGGVILYDRSGAPFPPERGWQRERDPRRCRIWRTGVESVSSNRKSKQHVLHSKLSHHHPKIKIHTSHLYSCTSQQTDRVENSQLSNTGYYYSSHAILEGCGCVWYLLWCAIHTPNMGKSHIKLATHIKILGKSEGFEAGRTAYYQGSRQPHSFVLPLTLKKPTPQQCPHG